MLSPFRALFQERAGELIAGQGSGRQLQWDPWPSPGPPPVSVPSTASPNSALNYTTISGIAFAGFIGIVVSYFLFFCLQRMCCPPRNPHRNQPTNRLQRWWMRRRGPGEEIPELGAGAAAASPGLGGGLDYEQGWNLQAPRAPGRGVPTSVVGTFPVKEYVFRGSSPAVGPAIEPMSRTVRTQRMLAAQTSLWTKWRKQQLPNLDEAGDQDLPPRASHASATPLSSVAAIGPRRSPWSTVSFDGLGPAATLNPAAGGAGGRRGVNSLARSLMLRVGGAFQPAAVAAPAGDASRTDCGGTPHAFVEGSGSSGDRPPSPKGGVDGDDCSSSFIALDIAPDADQSLAAAQHASRFAGGGGNGRDHARTPTSEQLKEEAGCAAATEGVEVVPGDVEAPQTRAMSFLENPSCPICLCEFVDGDLFRQLPCQHEFHRECIDSWMETHCTCPLCRLTLWEEPPPQ